MSGERYFLDTNAIVALLAGDSALESLLKQASWIGFSVISSIEFLSFRGLSTADVLLFKDFESIVSVIDLLHMDTPVISKVTEIRSVSRLKLPDAIIAASAVHAQAILITRDQQILNSPAVRAIGW